MLLAVVLFFAMNWIGKNSISVGYRQLSVVFEKDDAPAFNFLFKVIGPVVYLILCVVLFQAFDLEILTEKCYFIVVYYWAFRLVWNFFFNRWKLLDLLHLILYWISSIGVAYWMYTNIEKVDKILPDGKGLIDQMWILIIAFLYELCNRVRVGEQRTIKRKDHYLRARYDKFKGKFGNITGSYFNNDFYENIVYAIMIYEDFNRPFLIRKIEDLRFFITRKPHTLGIMQVTTDKYINDEESVRQAVKKIAGDINAFIEENRDDENEIFGWNLVSYIANKYNGGSTGYSGEISDIFCSISRLYYNNQIPENFNLIPD